MKQTTISASARMVHLEIEGDDAFVASVAGAVANIIKSIADRQPAQAPKPKRAKKRPATAGEPTRSVRATKGGG